MTREEAEALDAADPLARFRERFLVHDPELVYADGNSLGRLPLATAERMERLVREWGERLVGGWHEWIELPLRVGERIGELLGAEPGETLACDSTTVNLYKLARAAVGSRPGAIVVPADDFPTDRYVLSGLGRDLVLAEGDVREELGAREVALVCLSHVDYRTGELADMAAVTRAGREAGALVLWDLSHSAGAVPVRLGENGVDLAVGCTYKYLNAGPGSPAFLYVRRDLQPRLRSPIQGWFGQRDQFAMGPEYEPAEGVERFLAGTPPILGLAAVEEGVALLLEAGESALRAKSIALTELAIALHDALLAPLGFELGSPREAARRGAHVSLRHRDAWRVTRALIERARVVPDFRGPDFVRLAFPPLYTRYVDVWQTFDRLRRLVERRVHEELDDVRSRVT